ncbi:MAG: acyl-CoA dehydrogenase family protein [Tepidiformaceae bacterium]
MDHRLTESQELLRKSAADFFNRQYPLDRMRELYGDRPRRDAELWPALISLGWTAAPFGEAIGGFPGSLMEAAPLIEELGRAAFATPFVHSSVAAGLALASRPEAADLAAKLASGVMTAAWCAPSGLDGPLSASGGAISGTVRGAVWPELVTHFLVPAGDVVALVDAAAGGISRRNLETPGAESVGEVSFSEAPVVRTLDAALSTDILLGGAAGNAIILLGASERALEIAVDYAKMRIQFGQPIGAFQSIQHRCADMLIAVEVSRNLAYKAAAVHGTSEFPRAARNAKAYLGDSARRVTRDAIQIHGGVGFVDDHRVQLSYRTALSASSYYETSPAHRAVVSQLVLAGRPT